MKAQNLNLPNPVIKELQNQAKEVRELLKHCEELIKSIQEFKTNQENLKSQLEQKILSQDGIDKQITQVNIAKVENKILEIDIECFGDGGMEARMKTIKSGLDKFAREGDKIPISYWKDQLPNYKTKRIPQLKKELEDFYQKIQWQNQ